MTAVMQGIRILEVAEHTFVPAASAILADWGADVIKIEHVERGDAMRGLAATGTVDLGAGKVHALLEHSNRGKRSLGLDLSTAEGLEILYRLAATCDVFLTNKLPKVRAKLSIDVEDIRAHNPKIIYVRGSGFGPKGPDADSGGYDILGYWARSGLAMGGTPEGSDQLQTMPGPAYGDSIGAMNIAGGIAAALLHRERTGEATVVDVSLMASGMWALGAGIALSMQSGKPWRPRARDGSGLRNPLAMPYATKDGHWVYLSCLQAFHYWPDACRVIGRPELVGDERFDTVAKLTENATAAAAILAAEFVTATLAEWKERLRDFTGQWAPVQDTVEVANDEQVTANGYLVDAEMADGTQVPLVATPVQFDGAPSRPRRAPEFNEHGDDILTRELGLGWDAVVDLKVKGVVA
ncbi:CaiB/BaiF CoA transferase family protein [Frankia gtarii]|uniref:CaiB/BaiF CoA transferase family protein n=1 Tax=Frankia gtarii TaxID=2950102 RepID=UPI0021BE5FB0|nr:CoA transferase [Frankia gtarii]